MEKRPAKENQQRWNGDAKFVKSCLILSAFFTPPAPMMIMRSSYTYRGNIQNILLSVIVRRVLDESHKPRNSMFQDKSNYFSFYLLQDTTVRLEHGWSEEEKFLVSCLSLGLSYRAMESQEMKEITKLGGLIPGRHSLTRNVLTRIIKRLKTHVRICFTFFSSPAHLLTYFG